ncbi:MAG: glycosyl hydrolase family 28-related protein [Pseudomonadota bacterium]
MNKAITDGVVLMPLPFAAGLGVWSSGDGTPGTDTYATDGSAQFVAADQDFGGCLELVKDAATKRLRYMGETPILPGCYLRVSARVKAEAGPMPTVRISAYPGAAGGGQATGHPEVGPATTLTTIGEVVEISTIVGVGDRTGVDMVWPTAVFGHFGLDVTGANGGAIRIDDLEIEDITVAFLRDMISVVDVRDFGAKGDGTTDDSAAFEAADAAAAGRTVFVSEGQYYLGSSVTIQSRIKFEGTVIQGASDRFILQTDYNYESYLDAFGDEETAFRKAYQALLNFSDHESLDLCGRRISLTGPLDMQAADPSRTVFATRRVIRNGQFEPVPGPAWDTQVVTSPGTYNTGNSRQLTNVDNVANVPVGALVEAAGVGREVYVTDKNVGARTVTLSQPLYDAVGTQSYVFRRFQYMLDFSGYDDLAQMVLTDIDFQCAGEASAIMLAPAGLIFHVKDCFITKPKDRGITSIGTGCQGMLIDRCNFTSNEQGLTVSARTTLCFNANANDVKIRDNRAALFKHFCVLAGSGNLVSGNHWFHGDSTSDGVRLGGMIFTLANSKSVITGNYIDNNFIELTNEHEAEPGFDNQFSFGGLTITGNIFTANDVAPWFNFIVVKPFGAGHFIHGLSVVSNVFRAINGTIDRIESVDTSLATLDFGRMRGITFAANTFHSVDEPCYNPALQEITQVTAADEWQKDNAPLLPFGGRARFVDAVVADGPIRNNSNAQIFDMPFVSDNQGANQTETHFTFSTPVTGKLRYQVRMDNPL